MSTLGEAITMARRASSLTQEELADAAHVTQTALSRYENDLRDPSDDTLRAIADALGVTPRFLTRATQLRGAMAVDAHMRRRATAKATVWKQLEARLNMIRSHAEQMLDEIDVQAKTVIPEFDPFEVSPADAARMVRMQWRMPIGPVTGLFSWIEAAGCLIIDEEFNTNRVDGLSQWIGGQPIMMLNAGSPTDRRRLTAAHELGHLCLHRVEMGDDPEREANEFAAEFLMPAEVIRPELRNLTIPKLRALKLKWNVSMVALIERAFHLKVLTPAQRTALYKKFSYQGWRTREPLSDELPRETARLAHAVGAALAERGLTPDEIAQLAGFAHATPLNPFEPPERGLRLA